MLKTLFNSSPETKITWGITLLLTLLLATGMIVTFTQVLPYNTNLTTYFKLLGNGQLALTPNQFRDSIFYTAEDTESAPALIIVYRPGCPDCEGTYQKMSSYLSQLKDTHPHFHAGWVNSRSDLGSELVDKYNIKSVPMAILIDKNNQAKLFNYTKKTNEGILVDPDQMKQLNQWIKNQD